MASRFRSGHQEELGFGDKVIDGRLHPQPFLPYSQPSTSAAPLALPAPEPEEERSPSWFRGLISGAGKLISSVIGSEGSLSSHSECGSDYSSAEEYDPHPNEHENHLLSDGLAEFNKRKSVVDGNVERLAIVSKSDSKLVIEQLLMQETFTRAEYGKLMAILRSRVRDIWSAEGGEDTQNEVPKRFSDKRPWQSLNQNWNVSGTPDFSPSNPSVFPPRYYASEAVTPDLCNKAVLEAKKWFEEKKLSSPIYDQEYGPCSLNTDMNQYCFDGDVGSPIEMARSYMQSLPPWRSPSFSTIGFKSPPSSDNLTCSIGTHLLPSSKVRKRDYVATRTWDPKENSRVSLKSIDNEQRSSKLRKAGSTTRPLVIEPSRATSATSATRMFHYRLRDVCSGEIIAEDYPDFLDRRAVELGQQLQPQVAFKEAVGVPKFPAMELHKYLKSDIFSMLSGDADMRISNKNQNVGVTSVTEAQNGGIPAIQDSHALVSTALGNGDAFAETRTSQSQIVVPAQKSIQKSDSEMKVQADNAVEVNPNSDSKRARSCTVSKPPDENPDHIPKDAIQPAETININGHSTESNNNNSHLKSMRNGHIDVRDGTPEPPANVSGTILSSQVADNNASEPRNEKPMKSTERAESGGKRRAKKVVRQKKLMGRWN